MNLSGTVNYEDDESKGQIVDDWLSNRSSDPDELTFGVLTHVTGCDWKRTYLWTAPVNLDVSHVDENEQTRQDGIGECARLSNLLPQTKPEVVRKADVDAGSPILNGKSLIKRARTECT